MSPVRELENDHQVYKLVGNLRPHNIVFDPADPACLSRDDAGKLTFRLLAPPDVAEALVVIRSGDDVAGHEMNRVGAAGDISFWTVSMAPTDQAVRFSLALRLVDDTPIYVGITGISAAIERIDRFEIEVDSIPNHSVPDWMRGAVIYQIFPDRFESGDPSLTQVDAQPWGAEPTSHEFMGGDLDGITQRLDYLVELGVDVIYLNPIFTAPSNHRYDTTDYETVDPMLGGNAALDRLVATAHERDIKILLDTSLNHMSPGFFAFQDIIANGPNSEYAGWFKVTEYPPKIRYRPDLVADSPLWAQRLPALAEATGLEIEPVVSGPIVQPTYEAWYGVPQMPRVDLQDPAARQYMIDVTTRWITEHDVDGWRMDVVRYMDHDFWVDLRQAVRAVRDDTYLLAEVMGDSRRWLRGDEFDSAMNYTFRDLCVDFFGRRAINAEEFVAGYLRLLAMYSPAVTAVSHNLLGSHDTPRFLYLAEEDERRLLLASVFQMTTPGAPGLYYGDELPLTGRGDPQCRRAFDWDRVGNPHQVAVQTVGQLRRRLTSLRVGEITMLPVVDQCISFVRNAGEEAVLVAINNGATTVDLGVESGHHPGAVLWSIGSVEIRSGVVEMGPHAAVIGKIE